MTESKPPPRRRRAATPKPETAPAPRAPSRPAATPRPRLARAKAPVPAKAAKPPKAATTPKAEATAKPAAPSPGPRRIWLSGASGFIGKQVARVLRMRGDEVVAPVRDPRRAGELVDMGVVVIEDDLQDVDRLAETMRDADAVVHSAGSYRVGISREERGPMWDANIGTTTRVLDAAEAARTPRIVYVSTVSVFGN